MKTLYFCSHDGDMRKVYKSELLAKQWEENGQLYFATEITYNEDLNIVKIEYQDFDDWLETVSDEVGTAEFEQAKAYFQNEFKYTEATND